MFGFRDGPMMAGQKNDSMGEGGLIEIKEPMLFDLEADIGEENDLAKVNPEVVKRLTQLAQKVREELGSWDKQGYDQKPIRH